MPKNLGVDTFPDPVGHFGAHWQAVRRCRRWASAPGAARLVFATHSNQCSICLIVRRLESLNLLSTEAVRKRVLSTYFTFMTQSSPANLIIRSAHAFIYCTLPLGDNQKINVASMSPMKIILLGATLPNHIPASRFWFRNTKTYSHLPN